MPSLQPIPLESQASRSISVSGTERLKLEASRREEQGLGWGKPLIADFAYNAYVKGLKEIPLSTRVPMQVWSQLEQFMREEKLDKSAAVRKLLWIGLEGWRQKRALEALAEGKVTFMKAAEIAGLDAWDFAELVKRSEIVWVKASQRRVEQDIRAAMAER